MANYSEFVVIFPIGIRDNSKPGDYYRGVYLGKLYTQHPHNYKYPKSVRGRVLKPEIRENGTTNYIETYKTFKVKKFQLGMDMKDVGRYMKSKKGREEFIVIYTSSTTCRETAAGDMRALMQEVEIIFKDNKRHSKSKYVFSIRTTGPTFPSKRYIRDMRGYTKNFLEFRNLIKVTDGYYQLLVFKPFSYKRAILAVSSLGLLLGSLNFTWDLDQKTTDKRLGKTFKDRLVKFLVTKSVSPVHGVGPNYLNSAFYFEFISASLNNGYTSSIRKAEINGNFDGIASFSRIVANEVNPREYLAFLKKYKVPLENLAVAGNKLYFRDWKDIDDLFRLREKQEKESSWERT